MINISEKDGATIIVIENPSASELRLIKSAREIVEFSSGSVWSKFRCNQNKKSDEKEEIVSEKASADDDTTDPDDDYPF